MSVGADEAPDAASVLIRMRGLIPSLSVTEESIARVILAAPADLGAMSISALAGAARVSDTSITRFSRSLGFSGYPELRLAVCLAESRQRGEAFRVGADVAVAVTDSVQELAGKVVEAEIRALRETLAQLDLDALDAAVQVVSRARSVVAFAVGSSALVAADLEYKLRRLGIDAFSSPDVHRALTEASQLSIGDAAIAISHSGRTGETLDPLRVARDRGATTIAVTNDPRSPLARSSRYMLTTAGRETTARSGATVSRMAQLLVVDCLYARLVQQLSPEQRAAFERADDMTTRHNTARREPATRRMPRRREGER